MGQAQGALEKAVKAEHILASRVKKLLDQKKILKESVKTLRAEAKQRAMDVSVESEGGGDVRVSVIA